MTTHSSGACFLILLRRCEETSTKFLYFSIYMYSVHVWLDTAWLTVFASDPYKSVTKKSFLFHFSNMCCQLSLSVCHFVTSKKWQQSFDSCIKNWYC